MIINKNELQQVSFTVADEPSMANDPKKTKTLIMNNSLIVVFDTPGYDTYIAMSQIVQDGGQSIVTKKGTPIEIVFEAEVGAARFGFYSDHADGFYLQSLVVGRGQGRHCWADFHNWCERLIWRGRAHATNLASDLPDANAWSCVIMDDSSDQLADEDFDELIRLQGRLAEAYVRYLDQNGRLIPHIRR